MQEQDLAAIESRKRGPIECVSILGRELRLCAHEYKCLTGQAPQSVGLYGGLQVLRQSLLRSLEAVEDMLSGEERRAPTALGAPHDSRGPAPRRPADNNEGAPDAERIRAAILDALRDGQPKFAREIRWLSRETTREVKSCAISYQLQELHRKGKIKRLSGRRWALA